MNMSTELTTYSGKPTNQYQIAALDPETSIKLMQVAEMLNKSGMYTSLKNVGQYFAVIQYGAEMGVPPMTALQNIHLIEGKPACSVNLLSTLMRQRGVEIETVQSDSKICKIRCTNLKGKSEVISFTIEEAKAAGLAGKSNWQKYPSDMLYSRCISRAQRRMCPEATYGMYTEEEVENFDSPRIGVDQAKNVTPAAQDIQPEPVPEPETEKEKDDDTAKLSELAKRLLLWCQNNIAPQFDHINEMLQDADTEQFTCLPHLYNAFALFWNDKEQQPKCYDEDRQFNWELCFSAFTQWRKEKKASENPKSKKPKKEPYVPPAESTLPDSQTIKQMFYLKVDEMFEQIVDGLRKAGIDTPLEPGKLDDELKGWMHDELEEWMHGNITQDSIDYLIQATPSFIDGFAKHLKKKNVEKVTGQIPPG